MATPVIATIGKATQDVFLRSDEFDPKIEGKVAYTELPLGAKLDVEEAIFATGGNATNAAVTFARQGLYSRFLWVLGTDPASQAIIDELDHEGVDTRGVVQDEKYRASYSCILLSPDGERTILNYHGSKPHSDGHPLDFDLLEEADWFYLSSLGSMDLLEKVITAAKLHDVKVMLNPAVSELTAAPRLKGLLEDVDVLVLNKEEMKQLVSGESLPELVRHGLNVCPVVIVSDGPNGVVASDGKTIVTAGMYEDVPVIDRTGAGDAFGSGFLSQWAAGKSLAESITFASANATSVVGQIGAKAGILHRNADVHSMELKEEAV